MNKPPRMYRAAAAGAQGVLEHYSTLRPRVEYHEDLGVVLWWTVPVCEPPYVGTTLDEDFPQYVTHWTPILEPDEAAPEESK